MTVPFFPPPALMDATAVGVGAVCGAMCRHQVGRAAAEQIAKDPKRLGHLTGWHTAGINVMGSFVLGGVFGSPVVNDGIPPMAASVAPRKVSGGLSHGLTPRTKLLLGVGFCGSFTTFSTYSVDIANMIHNGQTAKAFGYVATNNVGGIAAAAVGMMFAKKVFGKL